MLAAVFLPWGMVSGAENNDARISMMREAPPDYVPGEVVAVTLHLGMAEPAELMALGLYETIPEGWQFMGVEGAQPPPIAPEQGQSGVLEFAWISPPPLPCEITYLLQVPDAETGDHVISGHAEYRLLGPSQTSPQVVSRLGGPAANKPSIMLLGENPLVLQEGELYSEPGYKAQDPQDGDLTAAVKVEGSVNTTQPGSYTLMYSVNNSQNQAATPVRRVVRVVNEEEAEAAKTGGGGTAAAPEDMADAAVSARPMRARGRLAALSTPTAVQKGVQPGVPSAAPTPIAPIVAQNQAPSPAPLAVRKSPQEGQSLPIAPPGEDGKAPLVKTGRDEYTTPGLLAASPFSMDSAGSGTVGLVNTRADITTMVAAGLVALILLLVAGLLWHAAYQSGSWRKLK